MLYALSGTLIAKQSPFLVVAAGPWTVRVHATPQTLASTGAIGSAVKLFTSLYWREDVGPELYGFLAERELELFEKLLSVSGVGPKSALAILGIAKPDQLIAAINDGRTELLSRASGIGRKTAERIIIDLKGKFAKVVSAQSLELMESDAELEDTLVALGFSKSDARARIAKLDPKVTGFKERLKAALKK